MLPSLFILAALEEGWAFAAPGADVFWMKQLVADIVDIPVSIRSICVNDNMPNKNCTVIESFKSHACTVQTL